MTNQQARKFKDYLLNLHQYNTNLWVYWSNIDSELERERYASAVEIIESVMDNFDAIRKGETDA